MARGAGVVVFLVAGIAWLVALVSWVLAVRNRKPDVSLASLLFSGLRAFDATNFTEAGRPHQRRFVIAFASFFAAVIAGVVLGALSSG
jgi:hypothetical protein